MSTNLRGQTFEYPSYEDYTFADILMGPNLKVVIFEDWTFEDG